MAFVLVLAAASVEMKQVNLTIVAMALVVIFSAPLWAGGPRVAPRAIGGANAGVAPAGLPAPNSANGIYIQPGYRFYLHGYYPGTFYPPVIVTPYAYPYYLPPTIVVNLPFFCVLHQVGFWTRAGMLDHLAGTHKFPLEAAATICPDGVESCLFPAY